jgi:DNA-binding FadR family transcriptional regulator
MPVEELFTSVAPRVRLADQVASQLENLIVEGHLQPGTRLPTETELCEQFNVSRTVVREAVQRLVSQGLVETRRGRGAGTTVLPASRDILVSSLSRFLNRQEGKVAFEDLHQVRCILELATARLAAVRATPEDIANLEHILTELEALRDDREAFAVKDADFHRMLAQATHNPLIVVLLDSIRDLLREYILSTLPHVDIGRDVMPRHREILERVAARDAAGARQAMWRHITSAPWEQNLDEDWA